MPIIDAVRRIGRTAINRTRQDRFNAYLKNLPKDQRRAYNEKQAIQGAKALEHYAEENKLAEIERQKEMQEELLKLKKLVMKEEQFFKDNKYTVEKIKDMVRKDLINARTGKLPDFISDGLVQRLAVNLVYMAEKFGAEKKLSSQQKLKLIKDATMMIGVNIAENPSSSITFKKHPEQLNVLIREVFDQMTQPQN